MIADSIDQAIQSHDSTTISDCEKMSIAIRKRLGRRDVWLQLLPSQISNPIYRKTRNPRDKCSLQVWKPLLEPFWIFVVRIKKVVASFLIHF